MNKCSDWMLWASAFIAVIYLRTAMPIAPMEPSIESIRVLYQNGDSITMECDNGVCEIEVWVERKYFRFSENDLHWEAVPTSPILYTGTGGGVDFSFEIQIVCPEELRLPIGKCFAGYSVSGEEITDRRVFFIPSGKTQGITKKALNVKPINQ